jgi:hypothetical protein
MEKGQGIPQRYAHPMSWGTAKQSQATKFYRSIFSKTKTRRNISEVGSCSNASD